MSPLVLRAMMVAIGAAMAFGAGWLANGWRLDRQIAQIERDQMAAAEAASEAARLKERAWNKQLEDARNDATKREAAIRADASAARQSADGLRDQLAANKRAMSNAAADAVRQYADTLGDVLSQCTAYYRSMAETADRLANDRQTLMDAWPK